MTARGAMPTAIGGSPAGVDDVINVSGHRMGTAEVESALVAHEHVAEAAVVGFPHDIKGQGIYAYVTLNAGIEESDALVGELRAHVRTVIGPIATPDHLHLTAALPKTRSGKIMRRILRKIAENDFGSLGDHLDARRPQRRRRADRKTEEPVTDLLWRGKYLGSPPRRRVGVRRARRGDRGSGHPRDD